MFQWQDNDWPRMEMESPNARGKLNVPYYAKLTLQNVI